MTDGQINEALRRLSEQMGELRGEMGGVRVEMKRLADSQSSDNAALWTEATKTRDRVGSLEGDRRALKAWAAAIALGVSLAWQWLTSTWSGGR